MHILYEIQFKKQKTHVQKTASQCLFSDVGQGQTNHGKLTPKNFNPPRVPPITTQTPESPECPPGMKSLRFELPHQ